MGGWFSDLVLGVGAVEVDVAAVGVAVLLFDSIEPEDAGEDGVVTGLALPDFPGKSPFEGGEKWSPLADFFTNEKFSGGRLVGALGESGSLGGGGDGGLEEDQLTVTHREALFGDGDGDLEAGGFGHSLVRTKRVGVRRGGIGRIRGRGGCGWAAGASCRGGR